MGLSDLLSAYQEMKLWLGDLTGLERDTFHYLLGLAIVVVAFNVHCIKKSRQTFRRAFLIALVLAILMEAADLVSDLRIFGYWRWQAGLSDIARTLLFPVAAVLCTEAGYRYLKAREKKHRAGADQA